MLFPNGPFLSLQTAGDNHDTNSYIAHELFREWSPIHHSPLIRNFWYNGDESKEQVVTVSNFTIGFNNSLEQAYKRKILVHKTQKRRKTTLVIGYMFLEVIYGTEACGESQSHNNFQYNHIIKRPSIVFTILHPPSHYFVFPPSQSPLIIDTGHTMQVTIACCNLTNRNIDFL